MTDKNIAVSLAALSLVVISGCLEWFDENEDDDWSGDYECGTDDDNGDWPGDWSSAECRILDLVNERRAEGADCGSEGTFGPTGPLSLQSQLRQAARLHSRDMGERDYFAHESPGGPNGDDMQERMESAGYIDWTFIGENIAAGQPSPDETMDGWMASDGHCANIMNPDFTEIGIGYAQVDGSSYVNYWTQDFGAR